MDRHPGAGARLARGARSELVANAAQLLVYWGLLLLFVDLRLGLSHAYQNGIQGAPACGIYIAGARVHLEPLRVAGSVTIDNVQSSRVLRHHGQKVAF